MFQTKFVEKIKIYFMFNNFIQKSCCLWDNVQEYCRSGEATDDKKHGVCAFHTE